MNDLKLNSSLLETCRHNRTTLNPETIKFRCASSRTRRNSLCSIKQTIHQQQIKDNKLKTLYNRKKAKLQQISKQNIAIYIRINNQKSKLMENNRKYSRQIYEKKIGINVNNDIKKRRRNSIFMHKADSENLDKINQKLKQRDLQIKRLLRF